MTPANQCKLLETGKTVPGGEEEQLCDCWFDALQKKTLRQ